MNHGRFLFSFFNQKEIFIPSQYSAAIFHYNIHKHAKPEPNHIKKPPNGSMVLNTLILNKTAVFSYSCIEQEMLGSFSFKQIFNTDR